MATIFDRSRRLTQFSPAQRLEYVERFGAHSLAYSTLQAGMSYLDVPEAGFIAYREYRGTRYALGDPVCAAPDRGTLIAAAFADHADTCFVQIQSGTARLLHEQWGRFCTPMGVEVALDLRTWTDRGISKQVLRTARNQAAAQGILLTSGDEFGGDSKTLEAASRNWLQTRRVATRELAFLARPMEIERHAAIVRYVAAKQNQVIGFVIFDPMFLDRQVIGYTPSISRSDPTFKQGLFYVLMLRAIADFKRHGTLQVLNLGLLPLSGLRNNMMGGSSRLAARLLTAVYTYGNRFYNFKGIEFTKARFGGEQAPVFFSHRRRLPAKEVWAVMRLSRVF